MHKRLSSLVGFASFIRQSKSHERIQCPWGNRQVSHSINGIEQNLFKRLFTEVWARLITDNGKAFVGWQ